MPLARCINACLKQQEKNMKLNLNARQLMKLEEIKQGYRLKMHDIKVALRKQFDSLVALVNSAAALVRDSLAVVGFAAIALLVVASQSEGLRNTLADGKKVTEWLQPSVDQEFSRLAEHAETEGNQMTAMMGLDEEIPAVYPQRASFDKGAQNQQQTLSLYLAKRYRISQDAATLVVGAAYITGKETNLDPLLILSVMAVESSLNPFAESTVGAQGLMQVLSKVHEDKLESYGGKMAALNPVVNIKVGAIILRDCIRRGGSLEAGLKLYVGATTETDGGYGAKVVTVRKELRTVVGLEPRQEPTAVMNKAADQPA